MVLMTVEAFERIVLLTMADCATDNEIVPVTIVRTIFMTMDNATVWDTCGQNGWLYSRFGGLRGGHGALRG